MSSLINGKQIKNNSINIGGSSNKLNASGDFNMGTFGLQSTKVPFNNNDLTNKEYVDSLIESYSNTDVIIAGENVSVGNVIYLDNDGLWRKADFTIENKIKTELRYVHLNPIIANTSGLVTIFGTVLSSGLTIGDRYYVGTNGTITNNIPDVEGIFQRYIGTAKSNTELEFYPDADYYEITLLDGNSSGNSSGIGIPEPTTSGNWLRTNNGTWVEGVLKSSYDSFVAKYPTTASNGKILQGNGTTYIEVNMPNGITNLGYIGNSTSGIVTSSTGSNAVLPLVNGTNAGLVPPIGTPTGRFLKDDLTWSVINTSGTSGSIITDYVALTYGTSINIDVSQTVNNKFIDASGNFSIVMVNKPTLADGFWGDLHIKKSTASDITITLDNLVNNVNYKGGTLLSSIPISGGVNIEEHIRFFYVKTQNKYYWEFLTSANNNIVEKTISGGNYTLSLADLDFTKNDQIFFITTSSGNQDFIIPADIAIPSGKNITVYQVTATNNVLIKKGNTTTVIINPFGGSNTIGAQSTVQIAGQNGCANLTFKGANTWYINGNITP
jgi:hypothetical protein